MRQRTPKLSRPITAHLCASHAVSAHPPLCTPPAQCVTALRPAAAHSSNTAMILGPAPGAARRSRGEGVRRSVGGVILVDYRRAQLRGGVMPDSQRIKQPTPTFGPQQVRGDALLRVHCRQPRGRKGRQLVVPQQHDGVGYPLLLHERGPLRHLGGFDGSWFWWWAVLEAVGRGGVEASAATQHPAPSQRTWRRLWAVDEARHAAAMHHLVSRAGGAEVEGRCCQAAGGAPLIPLGHGRRRIPRRGGAPCAWLRADAWHTQALRSMGCLAPYFTPHHS
jgi:hypothetical protein